jgi:phenylacetate-CoA ligase
MSSEARLKAIRDNSVTVLCGTPTYAIRLGEVAAATHKAGDKSPVKTIIVAGEPGGSIAAVRQRIEELWPGARVFDHHGMTETGPVTYECPARPGVLHVIESAYFAEVIDPASGQPARQGELILTTLGRTGSPLLRYRTGDLVKLETESTKRAEQPCACGRHAMALEGGILGRVDDMVIVRGVNVYPSAIEEIVRGFSEVAEYRVHVSSKKTLTELRLEIEPIADCAKPGALVEAVANALKTALALRVPVAFVPAGSLPRFEMKARRWVTE